MASVILQKFLIFLSWLGLSPDGASMPVEMEDSSDESEDELENPSWSTWSTFKRGRAQSFQSQLIK